MLPKHSEHQQAIALRKQGKSYSEILSVIPVSQASLSLWLRGIQLTKKQLDRLLLKKKVGQLRGGSAKKRFRESQQKIILVEAAKQIKGLSKRELWLLGIIAYWCEGSKQKENNISQAVIFANSDPFLLKLFIKWLKEICFVQAERIAYSLYIHETADPKLATEYWSKILQVSQKSFGNPILKKHKILTKRKNTGENYHGLVRIMVRGSTNLNRKITGWVDGIANFIN